MIKHVGLAAGMTLLALPAAAADNGHAADRVLAQMVACRQNPDARARAVCYDAAFDRLQQQIAQRQVVIVDREQVAQDRKSLFGFSGGEHRAAPVREAKQAKLQPVEDLAEIDSTVTSATSYGYEQWTIRLANGAIWRSTEAGITVSPRPGTKVHIHRALMGSFFMKVGSGRTVRAMRVG